MYTIVLDDGTIIYNTISPSDKQILFSPSLSLTDNEAGELSFTMPVENSGYDILEKFSSTITVYKDNEWFWAGRCITEETDFYKQKALTCEGVMAFLNDTHQESSVYTNISISDFINNMLTVHNGKVSANRRIYLGTVTVDDGLKNRYSEYEVTLEALNDLITDNGGHMYITYENSQFKLNYIANFKPESSQYVQFGSNLLDFTIESNMDNFASVVLPLGKEDEDTGERVTVASVNQGSIYVVDQDMVSRFGWIEHLYEDGEIEAPSVLLTNAQKILSESIVEDLTFSLSAIDLSNLDNNITAINLLDQIRVISAWHNLDRAYPVTELELDLSDPANDTFTLGVAEKRTFTSKSMQANSDILNKVEEAKTSSTTAAIRKAAELINTSTRGYVTIVNDGDKTEFIAITDTPYDQLDNTTKMWKWSIGGLGYSSDGGTTYGVAITMDGEIVGDYVTTGVIRSRNGNTNWDLDTGAFQMRNGNIKLGTEYNNTSTDLTHGIVLRSGNLTTRNSTKYTNVSDGTLYCGRTDDSNNSKINTGFIDGAAVVHHVASDAYYYGVNIVAPYRFPGDSQQTGSNESIIRFVSDRISISASNSSSDTSTMVPQHNYIKVLNQADNLVYTLHFINGWLTTSVSSTAPT